MDGIIGRSGPFIDSPRLCDTYHLAAANNTNGTAWLQQAAAWRCQGSYFDRALLFSFSQVLIGLVELQRIWFG